MLGDRWTMLVLREAFAGTSRFDRFQTKLEIGRTLLAERLNRLVAEGIFERVKYSERPEPRPSGVAGRHPPPGR